MRLDELIERLQEAAQKLGTPNPVVSIEIIDRLPGCDERPEVVEVEHSNGKPVSQTTGSFVGDGKPVMGGFTCPRIVIRG